MDQEKVTYFLSVYGSYYPAETLPTLIDKLKEISEERFMMLSAIEKKDPTIMLILSIFFGHFGIDRFLLGEIGMGLLKFLTFGCCGVLTVIDWFTIVEKTKKWNYLKAMLILQ